jgi:hypothetical protein
MTDKLELDHLFICVRSQAPEAKLLHDFGLTEGFRRNHPGQGTTNVCFGFENAYLELLWLCDANEVQSEIVRPMGLWERCRWRETEACPFGIGLRSTNSDSLQLPFSSWNYYAPFLPPVKSIPIATNSNNLTEPLIFFAPNLQKPFNFVPENRPLLIHPLGLQKITKVKMSLPGEGVFSVEMFKLMELGLVQFERGEEYHLEIEFDRNQTSQFKSFEPILPLSIRW